MKASPNILDAIVIGAGPSGLGASLALAGWRPRFAPRCAVEDVTLQGAADAALHSILQEPGVESAFFVEEAPLRSPSM